MILSSLIVMWPESHKRGGSRKYTWKNKGQNFSKVDENYKLRLRRLNGPQAWETWSEPRHVIIRLFKTSDKEKIIKAAREQRNVTHKRIKQFLLEALQVRRQRRNTFNVLKSIYAMKTSFKVNDKIVTDAS